MNAEDKKDLLALLTDTHTDTKKLLEGADLELVAHRDSGWRVRDILGHVATWEMQATKSILAFIDGREYAVLNIGQEKNFNEKEVAKQRELSTQQVVDEWERGHKEFKEAVAKVPEAKLTDELLYPWGGERGNIAKLVNYMCGHDVEHREEIRKAIKGG
jgi:hypothetical protein